MTVEQRHNSRLLWIIIGGISILVLLFLVAQWFFAEDRHTSTQTITAPVQTPAQSEKEETKQEVAPDETATASEPAPAALIDETILKTPVPNNPSLAKEEVAKLDDIQAQLKDQQSLLKDQHQDADTLIKLKEEQVKLLEAQLAEQK